MTSALELINILHVKSPIISRRNTPIEMTHFKRKDKRQATFYKSNTHKSNISTYSTKKGVNFQTKGSLINNNNKNKTLSITKSKDYSRSINKSESFNINNNISIQHVIPSYMQKTNHCEFTINNNNNNNNRSISPFSSTTPISTKGNNTNRISISVNLSKTKDKDNCIVHHKHKTKCPSSEREHSSRISFNKYDLLRLNNPKSPKEYYCKETSNSNVKGDNSFNTIDHGLVRLSHKMRFSRINNLHTISYDLKRDYKSATPTNRGVSRRISSSNNGHGGLSKGKQTTSGKGWDSGRNSVGKDKEKRKGDLFVKSNNNNVNNNNKKNNIINNNFRKNNKVGISNSNKCFNTIKVNQKRKYSNNKGKGITTKAINNNINTNNSDLLQHKQHFYQNKHLHETPHSSLNSIAFSQLLTNKQPNNVLVSNNNNNEVNSNNVDSFSIPSRNSSLQLTQKTPYSSIKILNSNLPSTTTTSPRLINPITPLTTKQITHISTSTHKGKSSYPNEKQYNQDTFFISPFPDINLTYIGVCDGHGINGHLISTYIKDNLPSLIHSSLTKHNNKSISKHQSYIHKQIENSFILLNSKLSNNANIDSNFSGSTCVSLLFFNDILYSANVGDSRAIKGKLCSKTSTWKYEQLTRDHKATENDEAKRIIRFGGKISPFKEENGSYAGPERVWIKDKPFPGLAMTRSFGDQIAGSVGVICEPEIKEFMWKDEDAFVVVASDGLWEYVSNEDVVRIVGEGIMEGNYTNVADELYKFALKKWEENEDGVDDITIVVVFF